MKRAVGFAFGKANPFESETKKSRSVFGDDGETTRKRPEELLYGDEENEKPANENEGGEEEEIDPLDAFMLGVEKQVKEESEAPSKKPKVVRAEFEEEDMIESLMKHVAKEKEKERAKMKESGEEMVEDIEYDSDDNPVLVERPRTIESLPPLDHSEIEYPPFSKCFYEEHPDIAAMSEEDVAHFKRIHGNSNKHFAMADFESNSFFPDIRVQGDDVPRPVVSFAHFGFDEPLMKMVGSRD